MSATFEAQVEELTETMVWSVDRRWAFNSYEEAREEARRMLEAEREYLALEAMAEAGVH